MSTPKINEIHDEAEVERIARALCALQWNTRSGDEILPGAVDAFWKGCIADARAALSAIDVAGIRAETIEKCAKIARGNSEHVRNETQYLEGWHDCAEYIGHAIRALSMGKENGK